MKRLILLSVTFIMLSFVSFAQKQVTKFMDIPVDGSKSEMISQLKTKGFRIVDEEKGIMYGEYNGMNVNLFIVDNNDVVWRLMVCDKIFYDKTGIKKRFGELYRQFKNDDRYVILSPEDISNIDFSDLTAVTNIDAKECTAVFYQDVDYSKVDTVALNTKAQKIAEDKVMKLIEEGGIQLKDSLGNGIDNVDADLYKGIAAIFYKESYLNKFRKNMPVWFSINEVDNGKFYISTYFDNEYNRDRRKH